jgi:YfiR/HmsC-like
VVDRASSVNFPGGPTAFTSRAATHCSRLILAAMLCCLPHAASAQANELPEYRLKAAFLYNFALFTEWPAEVGKTINLCVVGRDPFGKELDELQGKALGERSIAVLRKSVNEPLRGCQVLFVPESSIAGLPRMLEELRDRPVLTVADCPSSAGQTVALNMSVVQNKVTFEANVAAARTQRLTLSSKLLRLATKVRS